MTANFFSDNSSGGRPAISRREKVVAGFAVAYLMFSAFAYSCVPWQAQLIALGLAGGAFAFLFLPVGYDGRRSKTARESWNVLKKFPLFWIGLALFLLMFIQGVNPAFGVVQRTFSWRLYTIDYITWLPTGVDAPYVSEFAGPGGMNAFRQMVIFAGPWLLLCALWTGVERRRAWATMCWILIIFGVLLVAWGSEMRISNRMQLSEQFSHGNSSFFATFLYQNQAGAWIALVYAVAVAVSLWHWENAIAGEKRGGGPYLIGAVVALLLVLCVLFTVSFGGIFSVAVAAFLTTPAALLWTVFRSGFSRGMFYGGIVAAFLLAGLIAVFAFTADLSDAEAKLRAKFNLAQRDSLDDRAPIRRASRQMLEAKDGKFFATGYGAGSYRWVSPPYLARQPEFQSKSGNLKAQAIYAHCDWLQMLTEWGIAGALAVAGAIFWSAWFFLKNIRRWTPGILLLLGAIVLFMAHACMDFLCYSMPLSGTAAFIYACAARLGLRRE